MRKIEVHAMVVAVVAATFAFVAGWPRPARAETQLWTRAGVHYRVAKRWRLDFEQRLRLRVNELSVRSAMPELALKYDVTKWLRLTGGYRYIEERNRFDRFVTWHRFFADLDLETKWRRLRIENRVRFQEQITSDFNARDRRRLRNGLWFGWDTDLFVEPYAGGEIHYGLDPSRDAGWHKYRLEGGLRFKLADHRLMAGYRFEDKIADANDPNLHVVLLQYHYNL